MRNPAASGRNAEVVRDLLHRVESGELPHAHAHGVTRMNETVRARHDATVGAVGICRRPISCSLDFAGANRPITNRGARQQPVTESDRVNERFERRTNLPVCRSERAVELALRVIAAAYERANAAAGIIDHNGCAFEIRHSRIGFAVLGRFVIRFDRMMKIGSMLDFGQLRLKRILRGVLHGRIERGVNEKAAVIDLVLG